MFDAEFDKLVRLIQRQHNLSEPVPSHFIKTLINLETSIAGTLQKEKEAKKKMNASNAKALTAMKQKIKKSMKEYESDIKKYQQVCKNIICGVKACSIEDRTRKSLSVNIRRP